MRWLVTGFGPFGEFAENPSQKLAERCGRPHQVVEVGFRAVEGILDSLDPAEYDAILHIGVSGDAQLPTLEVRARNHVGAAPDALGEVWGPAPIRVGGPGQLAATLWHGPELWSEQDAWTTSVDAGSYLCNYLFYRSLERSTTTPVGFLHIPREQVMPLDEQSRRLNLLLERCESAWKRATQTGVIEYDRSE